jgi:hypothetical protein
MEDVDERNSAPAAATKEPLHPRAIDAWARSIEELRAMHGQQDRDVIFQPIPHYTHDGKTIWFGPSVRKIYDPLLKRVVKRWGARLATETLETRLRNLILDEDPATTTAEKVANFSSELDAEDPHYRVVFPLNGISLGAPLEVSAAVRLVVMDDGLFDELAGDPLEKMLQDNDLISEDQKAFYRNLTGRARDFLRERACIVVELPMDNEKVMELLVGEGDAAGEGLPIVDFLQFCLACAAPEYQRSIVDWRFLYASNDTRVPYPMISSDLQSGTIQFKRGGNASHRITNAEIAELERLEVLKIVHLFDGLCERNDYDELLYLAIRAFAEGEREQSARARLLHYTTAFELFFSEAYETTRAVSEGVAFVWTDDPDDRMEVADFVGTIYKARSRSSHSGQRARDVQGARRVALVVILALIQRRSTFETVAGLKKWLNWQRFSSTVLTDAVSPPPE